MLIRVFDRWVNPNAISHLSGVRGKAGRSTGTDMYFLQGTKIFFQGRTLNELAKEVLEQKTLEGESQKVVLVEKNTEIINA